MHRNSIQGPAHKTLTLGCSAWEATYLAILRDGVSEADGHLYVERTAHGCMLMTPPSRPLRQVGKTIVLPLLHLHGGGGEQPFIPQPYHHSTLQLCA